MSPTSKRPVRSFAPSLGFILCYAVLISLSLWSWQKWDEVWIERSAGFFPPEFQESPEAVARMAWQYPIYRSNDSYQWVHLADAVAESNRLPLRHRLDEGPPEGRPNRWHPGLAYLLSASGILVAAIQDWPMERGIHFAAHWLGAAIHLSALIGGTCLIVRLAGSRPALLFLGLYFFNAAIAWDFAFSRLDHEAVFQFFFLFHLLGMAGLCAGAASEGPKPVSSPGNPRFALLAGIGAGFCWWISATMMAALSTLVTFGLLVECLRRRSADSSHTTFARDILIWGLSAVAMILIFCLLDSRLQPIPSIATLHPIFALAQGGAALVAIACLKPAKARSAVIFALGLLCGASPLIWIIAHGAEAHPWLDPMMRRLHDYIVEFQSPFANGLWTQTEALQAITVSVLALVALWISKGRHRRFFSVLMLGLLLLAILQTRWLGLLAAVGVLCLCLHLGHKKNAAIACLAIGLLILSMGTWAHKWATIGCKPGPIFVTDLILQVGARDINLNLQRLSGGETIHVAMPYAFAATSALFPQVRPLGTLYWENAKGIKASVNFFAGLGTDAPIDYVVVQGGRQGAPFAQLAGWVAHGDVTAAAIESGLAWRFSTQPQIEGWIEMPFVGTFGETQFSVRIFRREQ